MDPRIAFVVAVSGGGVSILEQVVFQTQQELLAAGERDDHVASAGSVARIVLGYYATDVPQEVAQAALESARGEPWADLLEHFWIGDALPAPERRQTDTFEFFRRARYDPSPILPRIQVPVLIMLGAQDVQTPTAASAKRWIDAFEGERARLLTTHVLGDEGHALWHMTDDGPRMRRAFWDPLLVWLGRRGLTR